MYFSGAGGGELGCCPALIHLLFFAPRVEAPVDERLRPSLSLSCHYKYTTTDIYII